VEIAGTATATAFRAALAGESSEFEQFYERTGTTIEFRYHPSPGGVWVFARDVTERRRLEESLRQSQKLEAVGQLTGGIAHDFNNIVTAIMGYSEFALRDLSEGRDPARIQSEIEAIQTAGERARELTQQLLAFSRQQVLQPQVLDLSDVVARTERLLQRLIGDNIRITTSSVPDLALVKCDATQIEQVLMNLAVNARDAMPDGGTLAIDTANVEVTRDDAERLGVEPGPYVTLSVTDTGHGIPGEIRAQIFEPFFTTKDVGRGTGLGLRDGPRDRPPEQGRHPGRDRAVRHDHALVLPNLGRRIRRRREVQPRGPVDRHGASLARRGRTGAAQDDHRNAE